MTTQIKQSRKAEFQLTPDNVDLLEKEEQVKQFPRASEDTLKKRTFYRVIKDDGNNFFDDDSDIVLDDDYAPTPVKEVEDKNDEDVNGDNDVLMSDEEDVELDDVVEVEQSTATESDKVSLTQSSTLNVDSGASVDIGEVKAEVAKPSFGLKRDSNLTGTSSDTQKNTFSSFTNSFKKDESTPETKKPPLSFGKSENQENQEKNPVTQPKFGFGKTTDSDTGKTEIKKPSFGLSTSGSFPSFKSADSETSTPKFGFGKTTDTESNKTETKKSSFGLSTSGSFPSFKQSADSDNDKPDFSFGFNTSSTTEKKPIFGFTGSLTKSTTNESETVTNTPAEKSKFGFSSFAKTGDSPQTSPFVFKPFGSTTGNTGTGEEKKSGFGFSFGGQSTGGFGSIKSDGTSFANPEQDTKPMDHEEEVFGSTTSAPLLEKPDVPPPTGEENETVLFEEKCYLYRFKESKYELICKGVVKVNQTNGQNKFRIVVRNEGGLKLMMNAALFKGMKVDMIDVKSILFSAINSCDPNPELGSYLIKVPSPEKAEELSKTLSDSVQAIE